MQTGKKKKKTHRTKIIHLLHAKLQFTAFPFRFELTVLWETEMISSESNEIHRKVCQQTEASASLNQRVITLNSFNIPLHCFIEIKDERLFTHLFFIQDVFCCPDKSLEVDWQLKTK